MPSIPAAEKNKAFRPSGKLDAPFTVLLLLLLATGLICLFSASYAVSYYEKDGNSAYFILRQAGFAALGLVFMYIASRLDYHRWVFFALPLLLFSMALLASIKVVPSIWVTLNSARRWINVFGITTFQPSEVAKFAVIVFFSALATVLGQKRMKTFRWGILPFFSVLGIITLFLYWEKHISATIIILLIGLVIIFLGGASLLQLALLGGAGLGGAVAYIVFKSEHALTRFRVWLDPFSDALGKGWQGVQSQVAVGSGGFWGLGLGQSRQKHLYLPEPANDFIFAVICEELGFVFSAVIIIAFAAFIWRGYYIARHAGDRLGTLLAAGITTQVAVQVILNMCVVTGVTPVTGVALPFFSYGGTSLLMLLCEMGVLLNVSRSMPPSKGN